MSRLAGLEAAILDRHYALEEKAQQLIRDAEATTPSVARLTTTRHVDVFVAQAPSGGHELNNATDFLDDSVREVLAKAEKDETLERSEASKPGDCEVEHNVDVTLRLQRVKLHDLELELDATRDALREKEKETRELQKRTTASAAALEKEREKSKRQTTEIEKLRKQCDAAQELAESRTVEIRELTTRLTEQEKERRQVASLTKTKEVRQKRIAEELERCKSAMAAIKVQDRASRDAAKKDSEKLLSENKKLERQKSELVIALRKQIKLIDVLKRQKAHMEAAKLLSFSEDEFAKVISLGATSTDDLAS